jgi:hypothetical protein
MALAEGANAVTSTLSLLEGQPLLAVASDDLVSTLRDRELPTERVELLEEAARSWGTSYDFLIPAAGDVPALWAVHRVSGAVYGVLPDGSGGAASTCDLGDRFRATNATIALIMAIGDLALPLDFVGGTLLSLSVAITQTILLESAIISALPPTSISPEELEKIVAQLQVAIDDLGMVAPLAAAGEVPYLGKAVGVQGLIEAIQDLASPEVPICF